MGLFLILVVFSWLASKTRGEFYQRLWYRMPFQRPSSTFSEAFLKGLLSRRLPQGFTFPEAFLKEPLASSTASEGLRTIAGKKSRKQSRNVFRWSRRRWYCIEWRAHGSLSPAVSCRCLQRQCSRSGDSAADVRREACTFRPVI
jgi:hypothetical protein